MPRGICGLTGEQWVREGGGTDRWPRNPILAAAAAALVAVDAMTFADAQALIADYDPALTRGRDHRDPVSGADRPARCPGAARHRPAPGSALRAGN